VLCDSVSSVRERVGHTVGEIGDDGSAVRVVGTVTGRQSRSNSYTTRVAVVVVVVLDSRFSSSSLALAFFVLLVACVVCLGFGGVESGVGLRTFIRSRQPGLLFCRYVISCGPW
jgi:hypothetical protein